MSVPSSTHNVSLLALSTQILALSTEEPVMHSMLPSQADSKCRRELSELESHLQGLSALLEVDLEEVDWTGAALLALEQTSAAVASGDPFAAAVGFLRAALEAVRMNDLISGIENCELCIKCASEVGCSGLIKRAQRLQARLYRMCGESVPPADA